MSTSDWSDLPSDLITCIGALLIANDFADFNRFRAVCHPWRSSTEEMKRCIGCQHPPYWIMLSNPELSLTEPIEFYNTTHKSFCFDLTVHLDKYSLFGSFGCMILLKNNNTQGFALLNPFINCITQLPSKIHSNCPKAPSKLEDLIHDPLMNRLSDVYVTSSSIIVLRFSTLDDLVWTKPGDESWAYAQFEVSCFGNVLFYEDRIFAVVKHTGLVQIKFANEMPSQPNVEVVIPGKLTNVDYCYSQYNLVDCGGNVILFSLNSGIMYDEGSIEMYKLDFKEKKRICLRKLGNHSIFLGQNRILTVSCENLRLIRANCMYLSKLYNKDESTIRTTCYNLSNNDWRIWSKEPLHHPPSIVKKLAKYCLRPNVIETQKEDGSIMRIINGTNA